jgi:hypothetical protein
MKNLPSLTTALALLFGAATASAQTPVQLAGNPLARFPFFEQVRAFNHNAPVRLFLDVNKFPGLVGQTVDIYVVADRTAAEWALDPSLVEARAGSDSVTVQPAGNTYPIVEAFELPSSAGTTGLGVGYDVVVDVNRNGVLDAGDLIDGLEPDEAGFYLVHDTTLSGPLAVSFSSYAVSQTTAGFANQRTAYPAAIAGLGKLPLIIISHGNGHSYLWYDYLLTHLASYGYIVMSHQNNTVPGIESCSLTTLQHTDAILREQATIAGGVLNGRIDETRIVWIGHSRGGEGVARAYDRITDLPPSYAPTHFVASSIRLISSIAPTDFLGPASSNPKDANYHLLYGAADGDVSGVPNNDIADSFNVYERAAGYRTSHYLHGVGHNEFNCCGFNDATGPALIGRPAAQTITKGYYLPLIKHFVEGNLPAKDYLWRQYEQFRPIGALDPCGATDATTCATVVLEYKDGPAAGNFVIDDYQTEPSLNVSSSGGAVTFNVVNVSEALLNDTDGSFTWSVLDPMNGMTRARVNDTTRGVVFDATANFNPSMQFEVIPGQRDFTAMSYLSFRAAQQTRHPLTTARLGDAFWFVSLRDGSGRNSTPIRIDAYGGGIEEPYQRTGSGIGAGWQNEFETIRIRLTDFTARSLFPVDLTDIVAVTFSWQDNRNSFFERIALDDLEVVRSE